MKGRALMSLPGVYETTLKNGTTSYRSSMTYKNKHISLGSFNREEKAHDAYVLAHMLLSTEQMQIHDYSDASALSFEKWVSLINLRDNGIYFATPIYLQKSYFIYYLSKDIELKFDLDDLFYYASHKIMRRNGHLFVADYGMQVSIPSRYGIKNYAIAGKDYIFINQDPYDFRYENIQILNTYYGVSAVKKKEKLVYQAKIHIRSYYVIGYYESALEAAIAYNKAIDILNKNGIVKNYTINYIDEVPASVYANIYDGLVISDKIYQLKNKICQTDI